MNQPTPESTEPSDAEFHEENKAPAQEGRAQSAINNVVVDVQPSEAAGAAPALADRFEDIVSGRFDTEEESADLVPAKRVLQPQVESPKLHKVLAQAGLGSRLEMGQLILEGRISVNNEPAHIGQRV